MNFGLKFLQILLPPVAVAVMILSLTSAYLGYVESRDTLDERLDELAALYGAALVTPMWNLDQADIRHLLETLVAEPDVLGAVVLAQDGRVLARVGETDPANETLVRPIEHQGALRSQQLGTLAFGVSRDRPMTSFLAQITSDILILLAVVAVTVGAAAMANRAIVRELRKQVDERTKSLNREVVERRQIESELRAAKEAAEIANRAKTEFLAAASHDLRQPLQAIQLLVGGLHDSLGTDAGNATRLIGMIERSIGNLGRLLDTLLGIARLETGTISKTLEHFPLRSIIDDVVDAAAPLADAKGLRVRTVATVAWVHSDRVLLRQIVDNLVQNAIRYTQRGRVLIGCRQVGENLRIEVWDTGIGIPPAEVDRIFEEFAQLDGPLRQGRLGFGLGLSIVRRSAHLLGHPLHVRSATDSGSVFSVTVPRGVPQRRPAAAPRAPAPPGSGRAEGAVLVLDDDEAVRGATMALLERSDIAALGAADAEAALALVRANGPPGAVIVDYHIPGPRTGLDVYRDIVREVGCEVPGLIVSGTIVPDVLDEFTRSGLTVLAKPVSPSHLIEAVQARLYPCPEAHPTSAPR